MQIDVAGIFDHGFLVLGNRLLQAAVGHMDGRQPLVGIAQFRAHARSLPIMRDRIRWTALSLATIAERVLDGRITWIEIRRHDELIDGLAEQTQLLQATGCRKPCGEIARLEPRDLEKPVACPRHLGFLQVTESEGQDVISPIRLLLHQQQGLRAGRQRIALQAVAQRVRQPPNQTAAECFQKIRHNPPLTLSPSPGSRASRCGCRSHMLHCPLEGAAGPIRLPGLLVDAPGIPVLIR